MSMTVMRFREMRKDAVSISEFISPITFGQPSPHHPNCHSFAANANERERKILTSFLLTPVTTAGDDLMAGFLWSMLEVTTAFVIACVPATRLFLNHYVPAVRNRVSWVVSTATSTTHKNNIATAATTITCEDTKGRRGLASAAAAPGSTTVAGAGRGNNTIPGSEGTSEDGGGREGEGYGAGMAGATESAKTAKYVV